VRGEFVISGAVAVGLLTALGLTIPLARGDAKPRTIGVDEIKEGMKGYGLTVFKGTEPERFDVEVIGVLHNFRPSQELILVKTPHPRLNITKNVRGMSGSPIYLDGRLAGAYAYSWASFQVEPVAGVTPIAPMLVEMNRPIPPGFWPIEGKAGLPSTTVPGGGGGKRPGRGADGGTTMWDGAPGTYDVETHARQIADRLGARDPSRNLVPAATPLMLGGMGDKATAYVKKIFEPLGMEPLQVGGGNTSTVGAPEHYVNGGALGVQLVGGDVSFMGLGTATYAEGGKVSGFGHPMMDAGNTSLPATIGRVLWIFASDQHSSKIGESARPLGALVQDRMSSITVDEKVTAPTFPVHVEVTGVDGAPKKVWNMTVAEERFMSSSLAAAAFGSVVEATVNEKRDVTWSLKSKVWFRGHGMIELEDFGVAIGGMPDSGDFGHTRVARAIGDVLNNPWENARVEKVESVLAVSFTRDLWRLRGVELLDSVVDAGGSARMILHFNSYTGPNAQKTIDVKLPAELAGKDVELEIAPGYDVVPDASAPESLDQLIANETRQTVAPKSICVSYKLPQQGVAFNGHVAPRLPSFALDTLRSQSTDTGPDAFISYGRTIVPLDRYVDGRDKVKVKVRPVVR
jgi:SpoIVB peptidase S55